MRHQRHLQGGRSARLARYQLIAVVVLIALAFGGVPTAFVISNVSAQDKAEQTKAEKGEDASAIFKELDEKSEVQEKDVEIITVDLTKIENLEKVETGLNDFVKKIRKENTGNRPKAELVNAQGFTSLAIASVRMAKQARQRADAASSGVMQKFWQKEARSKLESAEKLYRKAENELHPTPVQSQPGQKPGPRSAEAIPPFKSKTFELLEEMKHQEDAGKKGLKRGYTGGLSVSTDSDPTIAPRGTKFFKDPGKRTEKATPGGISFIAAAAASMKLDLDLDAVHYSGTNVILSGRAKNTKHQFDAALFLTAIRLACCREDPYFSLDPENGTQWIQEGDEAWDEMCNRWERSRKPGKSLISQASMSEARSKNGFCVGGPQWFSLSLRNRYPDLWESFVKKYKNLRSKVVIYPEWLRRTRFGEILYQADVLLKELSSGVPVLRPESPLPADRVAGYFPSDKYSAADKSLAYLEGRGAKGVQKGTRLWFDLVEEANPPPQFFIPTQDRIDELFRVKKQLAVPARTDRGSRIAQELRNRFPPFFSNPVTGFTETMKLGYDGNTLDLSEIYPRMYVRAHDFISGKDLPSEKIESLQQLTASVNGRISEYARQYPQLLDLIQVFRAYVAASKMVMANRKFCAAVQQLPLFPSEELKHALPKYRRTDLFLTAIDFDVYYPSDSGDEYLYNSYGSVSGSIQGGIGLNVKPILRHGLARPRATRITNRVRAALAKPRNVPVWSEKNQAFVRLNLNLEDVVGIAHALLPLPVEVPPEARFEEHRGVFGKVRHALNLNEARRTLAALFAHRIYGGLLTLLILVVIVMIPVGVLKSLGFTLRRRSNK